MEHTVQLARHAAGLELEAVPEEVRRYAKVLLLDALGAGLHGSTTEVADLVLDSARARHRPGPSAVWGRDDRLEAGAAALVNGTQVHAYELDDYHPGAKSHPGAVVIPAALAVAGEQPVSGAALLRAVVAGYEVMIRVSLAADASAVRRRGWHLTGMVGPFGSATAAALLRDCSGEALLHALGVAGSCAGGLFAFSTSGAMTKRLHAGRAAEAGVTAVDLVRRGFTGPWEVLEGPDGFLGAVSDVADPARLSEGLGERFALSDAAIKPHSCCGSVHSSIDATIQLVSEHDLAPSDIEEITACNASVVDQQCGFPYRGSGGVLEAQMSLQYCLAVAATDRAAFLGQFSEERLADPAVRELAGRVRFELDPDIEAIYPRAMPARVRVRTRDGRLLEHRVDGPSGSAFAPWTLDDVADKLRAVTSGVLKEDGVDRIVELVQDLEQLDDVGPLLAALSRS